MEIYLFYNYEKKISKRMILLTFYKCDDNIKPLQEAAWLPLLHILLHG